MQIKYKVYEVDKGIIKPDTKNRKWLTEKEYFSEDGGYDAIQQYGESLTHYIVQRIFLK